MEKYEKWKEALDGKALHVNVGKTIDMQILDDKRRVTANLISVVSVENGLVVAQSNVCSVKSGFIVVEQMFHTKSVLLLRVMPLFIALVWG